MNAFTRSLAQTSLLEAAAMLFTIACVLLANKRSIWQYPVGITSTALFFFLFVQFELYSSAALQIVFTTVQLYGWWFWLRGDRGNRPRITRVAPGTLAVAAVATGVSSIGLGHLVGALSGAAMPIMDAQIFGFSMLAQFLLDRKKIEHWLLWIVVNAVSVYVYGSQGLAATTLLYAALFVNAFFGYHLWRYELRGYERKLAEAPAQAVA